MVPMSTSTLTGLVPSLRAEKISWRIAGAFLEVQIDLDNPSSEPTEPAPLVIEVAAFGAFVPFKPGARITVPGLDPWEERRVTAMIPAEKLEGLLAPRLSRDRRIMATLRAILNAGRWAGNLNVYFDKAPEETVELHRALDLKVQAGEKIMFGFCVGEVGAVSMNVQSSDPAWRAEVRSPGSAVGMLHVTAPAQVASRATIEVLVTRVSDGKTVPVVFGMETVSGEGETLGCIRV